MPHDLLVRNVPDATFKALSELKPAELSQTEFLRGILQDATESPTQLSIFSKADFSTASAGGMHFKFIDLFAGIGGFHCAMAAVGGECVFTSEWDKYAVKTYKEWYRTDNVMTDDIRDFDPADIPDHDVLCAGFPCQPFSLAGVSKKNSLGRKHGFEDEAQGNLFFSIMNIVEIKRPPVLFLENVPNLKSHDKGNTWRVIERHLLDADYETYFQIVDASEWVPQRRKRVFIVCFDKTVFGRPDELRFSFPDNKTDHGPTLGSILESVPDNKYMLSDKLWGYLQNYAKKHAERGNGFGFGINDTESVTRTMSARYHKDGSEILIRQSGWRNPRRLTPKEAHKLMGYNQRYAAMFGHGDEFPLVVSDTQAYRQCGNSVVPQAIESVAKEIVRVMSRTFANKGNGCLLKTQS